MKKLALIAGLILSLNFTTACSETDPVVQENKVSIEQLHIKLNQQSMVLEERIKELETRLLDIEAIQREEHTSILPKIKKKIKSMYKDTKDGAVVVYGNAKEAVSKIYTKAKNAVN